MALTSKIPVSYSRGVARKLKQSKAANSPHEADLIARRHLAEVLAARKRLATPKQRLEFVVEFIDKNLGDLSPSESDLQGYNLRALMFVNGGFATRVKVGPMGVAAVAQLQRSLQAMLKALMSETGCFSLGPGETLIVSRTTPLSAKRTKFRIVHQTPDETLAILHGFLSVLSEAGEVLRACKRCGKPFIGRRRQDYCSINCSQITRNETKKRLKEEKKLKQT
jgi:hypothetical protein